jgi:archaellum component FlaC
MWSDIFSAIKQIFTLKEQIERNRDDLKDFRRELKEIEERLEKLTILVIQLAQDIQNHKNETEQKHENLTLRLENEMLKFERRLPSGDIKKE